LNVVKILKQEGFIQSFEIFSDDMQSNFISISLKYRDMSDTPYITNLVRVSKPGFRVYVKKSKIPKVLGGIGIAIC
jgi:small subunit ribosomal protein S8